MDPPTSPGSTDNQVQPDDTTKQNFIHNTKYAGATSTALRKEGKVVDISIILFHAINMDSPHIYLCCLFK